MDETQAIIVQGEVMPISSFEMEQLSQVADELAALNVFAEYRRGISKNTRYRQNKDIALFKKYLKAAGLQSVGDLAKDAQAWHGVSGGVVKGFREWMLQEGYAIGSINVRLSTVKRYASLAYDARVLTEQQFLAIKNVKGLRYSEGGNIDKEREQTRVGNKKAQSVHLTLEDAKKLKSQPDTPQGRRDAVLMCILLDHGLRCGEIALLQVNHINLEEHIMKFQRPKVHKEQKHRFTRDTLNALRVYLEKDMPTCALLKASRKDGRLIDGRMTERAITKRVRVLGKAIDIHGLSAHDCRHYWATNAARTGTDIASLQQAGGWNSPVMPLRYIEESKIANEGVKLS